MRNRVLAAVSIPTLAVTAAAQALPPDVQLLADACNRFAATLHAGLAATSAPTASPASIALALLLLLPGARGDTATELATVLQLPAELRGDRLLAAAKGLVDTLGIGTRARGGDQPGVEFELGNDLWTQTGQPLVPQYVQALQHSFAAEHHAVAFRTDPAAARATINAHVAAATNQRIPELLPEGVVSTDTRVVLTNTIWLRAAWQHPFHAGGSQPAPFTLANGNAVDVPMMRIVESFGYAENDAWQALVLPFAPGTLVAEIVLPRAGQPLAAAERALLAGEVRAQLASERVRVQLPRFRVSAAHRLRDVLAALGLRAAFDPSRADFTGITPAGELAVADVVHQTWIQVDEHGAEAAGATAVVMYLTAAPPQAEPKVFTANRPFAFVLRDRRTGLVLFTGRVDDPRRDAPPAAKPGR